MPESLASIQNDLNSLSLWSNQWAINFSSAKSNVVAYRCSIPPGAIRLQNEHLTVLPYVQDLGVRYSCTFNFSEQACYQLAKAKRALGYISSCINLPLARLELYKLCVRPILEYCPVVHCHMRKTDTHALEKVQRRFTKSVVGYSSTLSYRERCIQLQIEPLWLRRLKISLTFLHSIIYGYSLTSGSVIKLHECKSHDLRNQQMKLYSPPSKSNLRSRSFAIKYSTIWNLLPACLRSVASPSLFRTLLHRYLTPESVSPLFNINLNLDTLYENGPDYI
jgi:hypothetical protein